MHSFLHDRHSPCAACSVIKSCLTLCKRMACSLPGSSVLGIFPKKPRILRGLPFSTLGDLPNWSVETVLLVSPALVGVFFTTGPPAKPTHHNGTLKNKTNKQTKTRMNLHWHIIITWGSQFTLVFTLGIVWIWTKL